ncbi:hypothetical protein Btru_004449 [Bulinus truncatus]|nr:hypothetical protein Btru_004449 [Bulinus truncatus]
MMKQWAQKVIRFSSQYNNTGWSAEQILGRPKVYPQYGDMQGAWASESIDSFQFIEIEFEKAVTPEAINIFETYNAGGTVAVKAMNPFNQWEILWNTKAPKNLTYSRVFSPPLKEVKYATNKIRIDIDCTSAGTWCEIDAVELVGHEKAVFVTDESTFTEAMRGLIDKAEFSDIKLVLNDRFVNAHKAILSARSEYFAEQIQQSTSDRIAISLNINHNDLLAVLSFVYTNHLPLDSSTDTLVTLCEVSSTLGIANLKKNATHQLIPKLNSENVVGIFLKVQGDNNLEEIADYCFKFMASHLKEMASVPSFETLPSNVLVKVTQEATAMISFSESS